MTLLRTNRRAFVSWALYDFANSSFTTLIVTFIYATYFTKAIAENETLGTAQWSWAVTATAIGVALLSPYLGAMADKAGLRRRFLAATTVVAVLGSAALYFPGEGQVLLALTIFTIANIAFETALVFYNAYLPSISSPDSIGRVSGFGWGLGYIGGLFCLAIALFAFVQTETPLFGFSTEGGANIRATNLLVAGWYGLFALPIFLWVKDSQSSRSPRGESVFRMANRQLRGSFADIRTRYRQVFRLLLARLVYNDGLITIFAFGGIYAQGTFGFSTEDIIIFGIGINVAAGLGALAFGILDDSLGGKWTINASLIGLFGFGLLAVLTDSLTLFWVAGMGAGVLAGPNQAASRSLLGRFIPPAKANEFFGFFAFSGKATAFLGPLLLGWVTLLFSSQRAGMSTILLFFVVGYFLLQLVDEKEGLAMARGSGAPDHPAP